MLKRKGKGWTLNTGDATYQIAQNGAVTDTSGAAVTRADVMIVLGYLDPQMKSRVWNWWNCR